MTVDSGAPGHLAELYGPTAELGGLGSTRLAGGGLGMTRVVSERLCPAVNCILS